MPGSVWRIATEPLKVPDRLAVDHFAAFPSEWPRRLILGWSPNGVCTACGEGRRPVIERATTPDDVRRLYERKSSFKDTYKGLGGQKHQDWLNAHPPSITGYVCACTPYTDHPGTGGSERHTYQPAGVRPRADDDGRHQAGEYERVGPWREYHFDHTTDLARPCWCGATPMGDPNPQDHVVREPPPTTPAVVLDPFGGTGTTAHVAAALGRTGITVDLSMDYCRVAAAPELRHARRRKVLGLDKPVLDVVSEGQGSLLDMLSEGEPA